MEDYSTSLSPLQEIEEDPLNPYLLEVEKYHRILMFVIVYLASTLQVIICIANFVSGALFIYCFCRLKRLQTHTNYIILHFLINLLGFSLFFILVTVYLCYISPEALDMLAPIGILIFMGFAEASLCFAFLLGMDWHIFATYNRCFTRSRVVFTGLMGGLYLIPLVNFFLCFSPGVVFYYVYFSFDILLAIFGTYLIGAVAILILNIMKKKKNFSQDLLRTSYALTLSTVFYSVWLPFVISLVFGIILLLTRVIVRPYDAIFYCTLALTQCIGYSAPTVMVILLGKLDKNFRAAYGSIFKGSVGSYVMENLDDDHLVNAEV